MFNPRKVIGDYNPEYPALDPTTSFYEFLSYVECCESLNVKDQPSVGRFMAYQRYLKSVGVR